MANIGKTVENLKSRGFEARVFQTGAEVADYLCSTLLEEEIAFGGSMTLTELGLFERLSAENKVYWHWKESSKEAVAFAPVYLTSANALAETGEIINIDGSGNRVVSTLYGRKKVYFIVGVNKIAEDFDSALWRARNIAAPLNARRLNKNTPCAYGELKCHDCSSPDRICRGLVVLWNKTFGIDEAEVLIVNETLGY